MQIHCKKYGISSLIAGLMLITSSLAAQNANTILDKSSAAYRNSNGITADFSITTAPSTSHNSGAISMKGSKFVLTMSDSRIWFDGKTQWIYTKQMEEVNVSQPSGEELQNTNPMLLIQNYKKSYTATWKGTSTSGGATADDIELTPHKKGEISKVLLQINRQTHFPTRITVTSRNGSETIVRISHLKTNINQRDGSFVFNAKEYPKAEIVDLRL